MRYLILITAIVVELALTWFLWSDSLNGFDLSSWYAGVISGVVVTLSCTDLWSKLQTWKDWKND